MRRSRRTRRGTNQFQIKRRGSYKGWLISYAIAVLTIILFAQYFKNLGYSEAQAQAPIISPVPREFNIDLSEEAPTEPSQREQIEAYIREVFGQHADKAFQVLSCENASLDPHAVNTAGNVPEGSRDTGVFQINEYWQQVQYKFLLNWKVNIEIAHQIFTENGNSFERWTCGRKLGI